MTHGSTVALQYTTINFIEQETKNDACTISSALKPNLFFLVSILERNWRDEQLFCFSARQVNSPIISVYPVKRFKVK